MPLTHATRRLIAVRLAIAAIALPVALVVTIFTWPFWGWFEATTGIESLGHSGPSDWCFVATYALCVAVGLFFFARR